MTIKIEEMTEAEFRFSDHQHQERIRGKVLFSPGGLKAWRMK